MCFLDTDMVDILGERMNDDASIHAGQSDVNGDLGKALRRRGRGARCTLRLTSLQAGYGALFLDASTLLLRDPRAFVKSKLDAGALLVTLSDFGGACGTKSHQHRTHRARPMNSLESFSRIGWRSNRRRRTPSKRSTWDIARTRAPTVSSSRRCKTSRRPYLTFDVTKHLEPDEDGSGNHRDTWRTPRIADRFEEGGVLRSRVQVGAESDAHVTRDGRGETRM